MADCYYHGYTGWGPCSQCEREEREGRTCDVYAPTKEIDPKYLVNRKEGLQDYEYLTAKCGWWHQNEQFYVIKKVKRLQYTDFMVLQI